MLVIHISSGSFSSIGSKYVYMLVECYRSYLPIVEQDPLSLYVQRVGGWLSVSHGFVDYYIPEPYAVMALMFDGHLKRRRELDYIV
jgi:hypothetical protein